MGEGRGGQGGGQRWRRRGESFEGGEAEGVLLLSPRAPQFFSSCGGAPALWPSDEGRRGSPTAAMGRRVLSVAFWLVAAARLRWLLCGNVLQVFPSKILHIK